MIRDEDYAHGIKQQERIDALESSDARICYEAALMLRERGYMELAIQLSKVAGRLQDQWLNSRKT